ncbi:MULTISPECIES: ATP-binding cassette domain-containing protein [unclassified Streptomyces]|uniref:ABC transporter ATP-binding protein n=1 Tax=unclassified Streptomyces TaxID=2593676 RepID=UPI00288090FC|nr:ATP-binding cassette domain-containing protein [Streptomyces sp. I6]
MTDGRGNPDVAIRAAGLTKVYPASDVKAVDRVDLRIRRGELFGLVGPNGAGKTTTMGMLTTRVRPTSGSARIGDLDVVRHPALVKQVIAVVSQQNTLDRMLSVWENLYFHGLLFGMTRRRSRAVTDELLEQFGLAQRRGASVSTLSGGLAQRLMIARAVFHRPAVLFLDEPTVGLDPQSRNGLWGMLTGLASEGQTILLTTHNLSEAETLCTRVAIMDHGRILAMGTPDELKRGVDSDRVVLVRSGGDLEALARHLVARMDGVTEARVGGDSVTLRVRDGRHLQQRVMAISSALGHELEEVSVTEVSLEDVYLRYTAPKSGDP